MSVLADIRFHSPSIFASQATYLVPGTKRVSPFKHSGSMYTTLTLETLQCSFKFMYLFHKILRTNNSYLPEECYNACLCTGAAVYFCQIGSEF
jgi:hypothetical protein